MLKKKYRFVTKEMIRNCFLILGSIKAKTNKIARLFYSFMWIDITKQRKMKKAGWYLWDGWQRAADCQAFHIKLPGNG